MEGEGEWFVVVVVWEERRAPGPVDTSSSKQTFWREEQSRSRKERRALVERSAGQRNAPRIHHRLPEKMFGEEAPSPARVMASWVKEEAVALGGTSWGTAAEQVETWWTKVCLS